MRRVLAPCASKRGLIIALLGSVVPLAAAQAQSITQFTPGDLVISTVSCQVGAACNSTSGGLDTASPISLQEFSLGSRRHVGDLDRFIGPTSDAKPGRSREFAGLG